MQKKHTKLYLIKMKKIFTKNETFIKLIKTYVFNIILLRSLKSHIQN